MAALYLMCFMLIRFASANSMPPHTPLNLDVYDAQLNEKYCSPDPVIRCKAMFATHHDDQSRIALLEDNKAAFAYRLQSIENAKRSIRIQVMYFNADAAGIAVAALLKKKRQEPGMGAIQLIIDGLVGSNQWTDALLEDLIANGIEVQGYLPSWRSKARELSDNALDLNKRFHEKFWLIDAENEDGIAIVGSRNLYADAFGLNNGPGSLELDAILSGPVVKDVLVSFERNFSFFESKRINHKNYADDSIVLKMISSIAPPPKHEPVNWNSATSVINEAMNFRIQPDFAHAKMRFVHNRPRHGETFLPNLYANLIKSSQVSLLANAYFVPTFTISGALTWILSRGGIIDILTNGLKTTNSPMVVAAGRHSYLKLQDAADGDVAKDLGASFRIFEWNGSASADSEATNESNLFHAKFGIFDDKTVIIGSFNLDFRSETLNSECAIVFDNSEIAAKLRALYQDYLIKSSKRLDRSTLEKYRKSSVFEMPLMPLLKFQL